MQSPPTFSNLLYVSGASFRPPHHHQNRSKIQMKYFHMFAVFRMHHMHPTKLGVTWLSAWNFGGGYNQRELTFSPQQYHATHDNTPSHLAVASLVFQKSAWYIKKQHYNILT